MEKEFKPIKHRRTMNEIGYGKNASLSPRKYRTNMGWRTRELYDRFRHKLKQLGKHDNSVAYVNTWDFFELVVDLYMDDKLNVLNPLLLSMKRNQGRNK